MDGSVYWKCRAVSNCKATITTIDDKVIIINGQEKVNDAKELIERGHTGHEALKEEDIAAQLCIQTMKSRAATESTTPMQIYKEEQCKLVKEFGDLEIVAQNLPDFQSIKTTLYNKRALNWPSLPKSLEELSIKDRFCETNLGEKFLINDIQLEGHRITLFCSKTGLEILSKSKVWHADGTFSITPPLYTQVYLIHGYYKDKMFPASIAILTGKTTNLYKRVVEELKEEAFRHKIVLNPSHIMTDYEKAAMNSFEFHFPGAKIHGCFFHFAQCLWKNFDLKEDYQKNPKLNGWFNRVVSLAFIPAEKVEFVFESLLDQIEELDLDDDATTRVNKFTDYMLNN